MGSSRPAERDRQPSTREAIPRLSEVKCKTIAANAVVLFYRYVKVFEDERKKMRNHIWILAGTISLGLGILGIFIPILPTTPLFLLAAFCYGRGSSRFYNWLMYRSWVGGYIRSYREGRGIPIKQKLLTIALLWLSIGYAIGFVAETWWLRLLLGTIAVGVTIHLAKIKTRQAEASVAPTLGTSLDKAN